jgi:hypothetical protein
VEVRELSVAAALAEEADDYMVKFNSVNKQTSKLGHVLPRHLKSAGLLSTHGTDCLPWLPSIRNNAYTSTSDAAEHDAPLNQCRQGGLA